MGRLTLFFLLAASLALFVFVAPLGAANGKPVRVPLTNDNLSFDLPAGVACSFELAGTPVANNETAKVFPADANGDVREIITGTLVDQLTNVATGKSITVKISGPGTFILHPDGSFSQDSGGANLVVFFPTDTPAGPVTYVFTGHTVLSFDSAGNETLVSTTDQHPVDICAALS